MSYSEDLEYFKRVVNSCETVDQLRNTRNLMNTIFDRNRLHDEMENMQRYYELEDILTMRYMNVKVTV